MLWNNQEPLINNWKIKEINVDYSYATIEPAFVCVDNIPQDLSKVLHTSNLKQIDVKKIAEEDENLLDYMSCIDCRQWNCKTHNFNIIWWWAWAAMLWYVGLMRTKWRTWWKLPEKEASIFDVVMRQYFMDYYQNLSWGLHTHDTTQILTNDMINTEEKLKEHVSCGALKNFFHGALFDKQQHLKIKPNDFHAFLDIYNTSITNKKATYVNDKESHKASHAILVDHNTSYTSIPTYANQQSIVDHLPTDYVTTVHTKVDDQSAYVLDAKVSHMLLDMYMFNFIDYLREQDNAWLTVLLNKILVWQGFIKEGIKITTEKTYELYKAVFAPKLAKQLERSRHNTATKVARLNSIVQSGDTIKLTQHQLKETLNTPYL